MSTEKHLGHYYHLQHEHYKLWNFRVKGKTQAKH